MPEPAGEAWTVPPALEGERIDRALALVTGLTRRQVNELVDAGRVAIAGRAVTSRSRRVHGGERLALDGPLPAAPATDLGPDPSVEVTVVWADEAVVVVDKAAGVVVHPGHGHRHATLVHGLLARFPDLAGLVDEEGSADRPGIVHRLDKGTSGLMVVARSAAARADLIGQLARREVQREYRALLAGTVDSDEGVIDAPLGRSGLDPTRFRVLAGGRAARTGYRVLARYRDPTPTTLVACRLETGRTHQIRVHFSTIGHPVVGDDRYGDRSRRLFPELFAARLGPGRPFLHAARLGFRHPVSGEAMSFASPLPADLAGLVSELDRRER